MTLSLREARKREETLASGTYSPFHPAMTAARRATDEALVRAVLEWVATECNEICTMWEPGRFLDGHGMSLLPSAVLDAVEKAGSE